MKANPQLSKFLKPYDAGIQNLFHELRTFVLENCEPCNELIWDNYNALALGYSNSEILKDAFCHIAVYAKHVNLGFNRGAELGGHDIKLEGKGKLIRHIKVKDIDSFPKYEVKKLLLYAKAWSLHLNPGLKEENIKSISKVMSISEKKIRPNK
jgi:hypothetical protein